MPVAQNSVHETRPSVVQDKTRNTVETDTFAANRQRNNVKGRKFNTLDHVEDGYYVIANVYKGGKYLNKFINDLNNQGFSPLATSTTPKTD